MGVLKRPPRAPAPTPHAMLARLTMMTRVDGSEFQTALRVVMMPRDANNYGSIFGGVIMSYIDQAGYIEARKHGAHRWVTASIERVDFKAPVFLGDVVSFLTQTEATGASSVKVRIRVEAERYLGGQMAHVTEAHMTMVAVDVNGRSIPFRSPATLGPA
jgi:acyl-CoA thioesterase YciA